MASDNAWNQADFTFEPEDRTGIGLVGGSYLKFGEVGEDGRAQLMDEGGSVIGYAPIVAMNDEAAEKMLAKEISDYITGRNLTDTTYDKDKTTVKELYYDFDYEGTVSLVSFEGVGGVTYYVGAWTITQTGTVQEWSR